MHIFDYSFLDEGLLPAEIVNLTAAIAAFNVISGIRKENNKNIYTELEYVIGIYSNINVSIGTRLEKQCNDGLCGNECL